VQSPSATASVRGTDFEFDTVNLRVYEGTVALRGNDGMAVSVPAGTVSQVDSYGRASDPVETGRQSLTPPAPVGTGSSGKALPSGLPLSSDTGTIIVTIE
jgi:hypothetical protein